MKKFLLFFLAFVATVVAKADYLKVTSTADLTSGEYLIVYEDGAVAFDGSRGAEDNKLDVANNGIEVSIVDGKIASSAAIDAATFTVDVTNGTLHSKSGYYIGSTSDANGLGTSDQADAFTNSFSIDDDGNAMITSSQAVLRFNAAVNQLRFRYYKSATYKNQKPIALYKKTGDTPQPILTFSAPVGAEVSLTFGVYDTEDEYSVDFGDGTLLTQKVGVNNAGPVNPETGQTGPATVFTGTVAGDGTIKVYGINDVWYLIASGGAIPTSFDQSKLMNVVQMTVTGANVESVELPAYPQMTQFSFNNSPVKTVDVSKVAGLTNLGIVYSSQYEGEMNLEGIDLQNNTELTDLSIQSQKIGVNTNLKEIDLSKNTKLVNIYLPWNSLTSITLPSDFTKVDNNDPSILAKVTMFLNNNQLASIDGLDKLPAKSQFNISNNLFTLATLPVKPANVSNSKYTYAPQPAYEVEETVTDLDLSSQLYATGILTEQAETTYKFVTAGGTELIAGTDYKVVEAGKFKFLTAQTEKVHGVMATAAFPKFTGANAYVTTEFTVSPVTGISNVDAAKQMSGKCYNLQGVEVQKPVKGLYIQNGKKIIVK